MPGTRSVHDSNDDDRFLASSSINQRQPLPDRQLPSPATGISSVPLSLVLPVRARYRDETRVLLDYLKTFSERALALVRGDGPDADARMQALRDEARARNLPLAFDGGAQQWLLRTAKSGSVGALIVAGDALGVPPAMQHTKKIAPLTTLLGRSTVETHRVATEPRLRCRVNQI